MWDLYIFPGEKVGVAKTRFGVWIWMALNLFHFGELRAINRLTGEHVVR